MTTPITASTNVYTIAFDGQTVAVLAKRRGKVLRQIALGDLTGVEFNPSEGWRGGSLRFRTAGLASARDTIVFTANQQPDIERLAHVVDQHRRGLPVTPIAVAPVLVGHQKSGAERWTDRFLAGYLGLSLIPLLLLAAGSLVVCGVCGWGLIKS